MIPKAIRKIYLRVISKRLLRVNISTTEANRKLCLELLTNINPENKFDDTLDLHSASITNITVGFHNLADIIAKIKETNRALEDGLAIPNDWIRNITIPINVGDFLFTSNGYYVSVDENVREFRKSAIHLCELLKESDTAEYGIHEHNLRVLTKLLVDIALVSKEIIKISIK